MGYLTLKKNAVKDASGKWEEITFDLIPVVPSERTAHLTEEGVPAIGTSLAPGMIAIGGIGRTSRWHPERQPNSLELHSLSSSELSEKYGDMWYDASVYVERDTVGIVEDTQIEIVDGQTRAAVVIRTEERGGTKHGS